MQLDSTRIAIVQTTDDCPGSLLVLMLLALLKDEDEDEVEMRWRWMNTAPVPENERRANVEYLGASEQRIHFINFSGANQRDQHRKQG